MCLLAFTFHVSFQGQSSTWNTPYYSMWRRQHVWPASTGLSSSMRNGTHSKARREVQIFSKSHLIMDGHLPLDATLALILLSFSDGSSVPIYASWRERATAGGKFLPQENNMRLTRAKNPDRSCLARYTICFALHLSQISWGPGMSSTVWVAFICAMRI